MEDIITEINEHIQKINDAHEKMMRGIETKFFKEQNDDAKINSMVSTMIMDIDNLFATIKE
jgi:hypothetical protein